MLGRCSLAFSTAPSCWNALGSHQEAQKTTSLLFFLLFCKKTLLLCEKNVKIRLPALWQCLLCSSHCYLSHQVSNTNTCRCLPQWQEVQRPWADTLPPCSWAPRPPSFLPSFLLSSACRYFSLIMCFFFLGSALPDIPLPIVSVLKSVSKCSVCFLLCFSVKCTDSCHQTLLLQCCWANRREGF